MNTKKIVDKYLKKKSDNILLEIIIDCEKQKDAYKIIKYILKNKIITNKKLINEALYFTVQIGLYLIVELLLKYGKANPNLEYSNGFTLIDEASDWYYMKTVKILFKYGAKGYIWCRNKKDCEDFLEDYMYQSQDITENVPYENFYSSWYEDYLEEKNKKNIDNNNDNFKNIVIY